MDGWYKYFHYLIDVIFVLDINVIDTNCYDIYALIAEKLHLTTGHYQTRYGILINTPNILILFGEGCCLNQIYKGQTTYLSLNKVVIIGIKCPI